jgi:hypothetical protein
MSDVHYTRDDRPLESPYPTVCRPVWPAAVKRTGVPRFVTCSACLDWMAANHKRVIADVQEVLQR